MIVQAMKYKKLLRANGVGAFGDVEYGIEDGVILRTSEVKTTDVSGTARIYFNDRREQAMTGRRFDPMPSGLVLLRPGAFYQVFSTIEIIKPLPEGVSAAIVLNTDASEVLMLATSPFREGFLGLVTFMVHPFRKIEMEKMTSLASLMFFEETANIDDEWLKTLDAKISAKVLKKIGMAPKKANSNRTKTGKQSDNKKSVDVVIVSENPDDVDVLDGSDEDKKDVLPVKEI